MKNQHRWSFSQIYAANEMMKMGGVLVILSLLSLFVSIATNLALLMAVGLVLLVVVWFYLRVEKEINLRFKDD